MAWVDMIQEPTRGRLLTALRFAFYPAFEPVETKHFQALTMEAENARGSGDLAKAEKLYSTAMAEARTSTDSSHLNTPAMDLGECTKSSANIVKRNTFSEPCFKRL